VNVSGWTDAAQHKATLIQRSIFQNSFYDLFAAADQQESDLLPVSDDSEETDSDQELVFVLDLSSPSPKKRRLNSEE
jgi:hypothetical protein